MKTVYLLPPSEGKNKAPQPLLAKEGRECVSFSFEKPCEIAINATDKDLKCSGKRYEEGIEFNKKLCRDVSVRHLDSPVVSSLYSPIPPFQEESYLLNSPIIPFHKGDEYNFIAAIERYSGVMYTAIDYAGMSESGKAFFEGHFLILSGMYGVVKPLDTIGNYKLPIESKGLLDFWGTKIIDELNNMGVEKVVNLLPDSYAKLIYGKNKTQARFFAELRNFEIEDKIFYDENGKRMTHGVKKVKGEWVKKLCEEYKN